MAAGLEGLELFGEENVDAGAATTGLGLVAFACHAALRGIDGARLVAHDGAAPALLTVLDTSIGEAALATGLGAEARGHDGLVELVLGPGERLADLGMVGPAARVNIVFDGHGVSGGEGAVLEHGKLPVTAAGLVLVAVAGKVTISGGKLGAVDGVAAVADAVVLEAGIAVSVAWDVSVPR